jgi:hypothetical protein
MVTESRPSIERRLPIDFPASRQAPDICLQRRSVDANARQQSVYGSFSGRALVVGEFQSQPFAKVSKAIKGVYYGYLKPSSYWLKCA